MSNATDKARFYLEQSVPELKEYEKKKIFSKVASYRTPVAFIFGKAYGIFHVSRMKSHR